MHTRKTYLFEDSGTVGEKIDSGCWPLLIIGEYKTRKVFFVRRGSLLYSQNSHEYKTVLDKKLKGKIIKLIGKIIKYYAGNFV